MNQKYIPPKKAYQKIRKARNEQRNIYMFGVTGSGKTRLIKEYLAFHNYFYFSFGEGNVDFESIPKEKNGQIQYVIIDDIQFAYNSFIRQEIIKLLERKDLWIILIGRCNIPHWLFAGDLSDFEIISEEDLAFGKEELDKLLQQNNISLNNDEFEDFLKNSQGNIYVIINVIRYLRNGMSFSESSKAFIENDFIKYIEHHVLGQWPLFIQELLLKVCIVDSFTLELAEQLTGDDKVADTIEKTLETGNFIYRDKDEYFIRPVLLRILRKKAQKVFGTNAVERLYLIAGNYYEIHQDIKKALKMYEAIDAKDSIQNLLIQNAKENPANGSFFEMRKYYLDLKEEDVKDVPILMSALSMLYSILMRVEDSEYWYSKLKSYKEENSGGRRRKANELITYLDIALPHRGSKNIVDYLKHLFILLQNGTEAREFSLTNNQPSLMNGGKDFCEWSKKDKALAQTLGPMVEKILYINGTGIVSTALAESYYEKGKDTYEIFSELTAALLQTEGGNKLELHFVTVGIQIRLDIISGNIDTAILHLKSFEKRVIENKQDKYLDNIHALYSRISLYKGDLSAIERWLETSPDENEEFCTLLRYQYLVKIRCYIALDKLYEASLLIKKLRYYSQIAQRTYIQMELDILESIILYRQNKNWGELFYSVLMQAKEYQFVRMFVEEGNAIYPLLFSVKDQFKRNKWFMQILNETTSMKEKYPYYLETKKTEKMDLSSQGLAVLKLQAEGFTAKEIARQLNITERTVKYHNSENYKKLDVNNKTEAIKKALNLKLL